MNVGADSNDSVFIQDFERGFTDVRKISGQCLHPEFALLDRDDECAVMPGLKFGRKDGVDDGVALEWAWTDARFEERSEGLVHTAICTMFSIDGELESHPSDDRLLW